MTVTVLDHHHAPALTLQGAGQRLVIQTGTLILELRGALAEDFVRESLEHPVLDLPPDSPPQGVRAIASAVPASMVYSPPPATIRLGGEPPLGLGLAAAGDFPVTRGALGSSSVPVPAGGWAVDRTRTARSANQIQLLIDLAVAGPSSLLRLAYSLFVTIPARSDPAVISNHDLHGHRHEP